MGLGGDPANEANLYDGHCLLHIWASVNLRSAIAQSSLMWALNNCSCIVLWSALPVKRLSLHTYSQQSDSIRKCSQTLIIFLLLTNKICRSCTYFYFILILLSFNRTDWHNHYWKLIAVISFLWLSICIYFLIDLIVIFSFVPFYPLFNSYLILALPLSSSFPKEWKDVCGWFSKGERGKIEQWQVWK